MESIFNPSRGGVSPIVEIIPKKATGKRGNWAGGIVEEVRPRSFQLGDLGKLPKSCKELELGGRPLEIETGPLKRGFLR